MNETKKLLRDLQPKRNVLNSVPIATDMFIPNHSGTHDAGILLKTPSKDIDLVNKKYVDDQIAAIPVPPAPDLTPYAKLDGTNQPFTDDISINIDSPKLTLTDTAGSVKTIALEVNNTDDASYIKSTVGIPAGAAYSLDFTPHAYGITDGVSSSLDFGTANFTLMFWVNPDSFASTNGWCGCSTSAAGGWTIRGTATQFGVYTASAFKVIASNPSTSVWSHIVIRRIGTGATDLEIWINGIKVASDSGNVVLNSDDNKFRFGRLYAATDNYGFDGEFEEIALWNRAITDQEIADFYNSGAGLEVDNTNKGTDLLILYHLNEGLGSTVTDDSGNSLNATLTGTVAWTEGHIVKPKVDTEVNILTVRDGATAAAKGKITLGNDTSDTYIDGGLINFDSSTYLRSNSWLSYYGNADQASIMFDGTTFKLASITDFKFNNIFLQEIGTAGGINIGSVDKSAASGRSNFLLGTNAGAALTSGEFNTAIGTGVLSGIDTESNFTAIGYYAMRLATGGYQSTAIGTQALEIPTTPSATIGLGHQAGRALTATVQDVIVGVNAANKAFKSQNNVAIGYAALGNLSTNTATATQRNIGIGTEALKGSAAATAYNGNVAIGYHAGYTTAGNGNLYIGDYAGKYQTGSNNFLVNSGDQSTLAAELTDSLLYGTFSSTVSSQQLTINAGNVYLPYDDEKLYFGAGNDASITFDGSALNIKADAVTASDLISLQSDTIFSGAGTGLPYGEINYIDGGSDIVLDEQDTWYQIVSFDTNGLYNLTTPDHTEDHITILKTGVYRAFVSISGHSNLSNNYQIEIKKNNGATSFVGTRIYTNTDVAGKIETQANSGLLSLTANDTLELWINRTDGGAVSKTFTIDQLSLNIIMVGG